MLKVEVKQLDVLFCYKYPVQQFHRSSQNNLKIVFSFIFNVVYMAVGDGVGRCIMMTAHLVFSFNSFFSCISSILCQLKFIPGKIMYNVAS